MPNDFPSISDHANQRFVPATENDNQHPAVVVAKDSPIVEQPKTVGQKRTAIMFPPQPEADTKPSTETVTVLDSELFPAMDDLHQAIGILATHSAAGVATSIIGEALVLLKQAEGRLAGLELK